MATASNALIYTTPEALLQARREAGEAEGESAPEPEAARKAPVRRDAGSE